jgi:hypothetical protein
MNLMSSIRKEQSIPIGLLASVFDLYTEMSADELIDFESRFFGLCKYLQEIGLEDQPQSFALIIDRRLAALAKFVVSEGTDKGSGAGMNYGRAELIRCAATEPLIEDEDGQAAFDRASFRRCLRTATEGPAPN